MKDLEKAVINPGDGKCACDSSSLNGNAKRMPKSEGATNSPTKYDTGSAPSEVKSGLGGRNRR